MNHLLQSSRGPDATITDVGSVPVRLTAALPGRENPIRAHSPYPIGILPGEGIGPEVIGASLIVLRAIEEATDLRFDIRHGGAIGLTAQQQSGQLITAEVDQFCRRIFADGGAILCGPGGGRFVYELREKFALFCKFVPLQPLAVLSDTGPIRPEKMKAVDILMVRENLGGLYQGEFGIEDTPNGRRAFHCFHYDDHQVNRILEVACTAARLRRGRLCVVTKPGGAPSVSQLWQDHAERLAQQYAIELSILEVDNACYQIIADPSRFDVVAAPNLFGDVLADGAAVLLGSRGMSYSANFSINGAGVYQTGHGAAYDLAGKDRANPIGQIQSLAFMLKESFGLSDIAAHIHSALVTTLATGWRTPDIAGAGCTIIGTLELGQRIADSLNAKLDAENQS